MKNMSIAQVHFILQNNGNENWSLRENLHNHWDIPGPYFLTNIFLTFAHAQPSYIDLHPQTITKHLFNFCNIVRSKWLLESFLNCPDIFLMVAIFVIDCNFLTCMIEYLLVQHPKTKLLQISHHMLETSQKITKLINKVIFLNGVIDEVLASPITKPIDIQIIMLEQLTIQNPVQITRMLQWWDRSCMHMKWTDKNRQDCQTDTKSAMDILLIL